jgi:molybdopterin-guanine dinucleotide biosynthesis protein A
VVNGIEPPRAVSGWILAGGASSRMGRDKALIDIGGRPLIFRVAEALSTVCETVSIAGDPDRYSTLGIPIISDRMRGSGPLSGIEAALGATGSDWNLIAACDMPSLDTGLLCNLLDAANGNGATTDAAIPQYPDGSLEPLCAMYHRRCHPVAADALARGVRRLADFIRLLTVRYVQVTDPRPFRNLNTPEDVENFRRG